MKKLLTFLFLIALVAGVYAWKNPSRFGQYFDLKPRSHPVQETAGCKSHPATEPLGMTARVIPLFYRGRLRALPFLASHCYRAGQTSISIVHFLAPGIYFSSATDGVADIQRIDLARINDLPNDLITSMGFPDFTTMQSVLAAVFTKKSLKESEFAVIRFRIANRPKVDFSHVLPKTFNIARTVDASEFQNLLRKGTTVVSVQSARNFALDHPAQAINIPYTEGKRFRFLPYAPDWKFKTVDSFDINRLPKDKSRPLVIYGQSELDSSAVRALVLAHEGGWSNLIWFRDGEFGRKGIDPSTPSSVAGINVLTAEGVADLMKKGASIFDVRSNEEFVRDSIQGATSLPYESTLGPIQISGLNPTALALAGDHFSGLGLPADKTYSVIFYGKDKWDWRPLKAAAWVKGKDWKSVYWYREGIADWYSHQVKDPTIYRTRINPER